MAATIWRGNIAFGLVSIPVRLVRAARRERTRFQHVYAPEPEPQVEPEPPQPAPEPIVEPYVAGRTSRTPIEEVSPALIEEPVLERVHNRAPDRPILKAIAVEPGQYVTFQPAELKAGKPATSTSLEIASFVHVSEIDPLFFDASYYVVPQPAGEKPYAILYTALSQSGYAALGEMAMHGREHAVLLRTGVNGLILQTLFYENEIHLEDQYRVDRSLASAPEQKMAASLVEALAGSFQPKELVDRYETRLQSLIESRLQSGATKSREAAVPAPPAVVDIMEALRKSVAQAKKPPAREARSKRRQAS